jgi:hypothetical protein
MIISPKLACDECSVEVEKEAADHFVVIGSHIDHAVSNMETHVKNIGPLYLTLNPWQESTL